MTFQITGSESKSKQKDPFSEVTKHSIISPTLANSILGIRPGERVGNIKCRGWWKATFCPASCLWEWPFSSQGAAQHSPARLPLHPLHAFVHLHSYLFIGKANLLFYMTLELISLLLIRTSSSLSLALICLYSLYSSAIGVRSSFCTFLVGVRADHENFCNRMSSSQYSPSDL